MVDLPLSDDAWARINHLFEPEPKKRLGRPARPPREILDAILWVVTRNEKWHRLPGTFPPSQTCYIRWLQWRRTGLMNAILDELGLSGCVLDPASCANSAPAAESNAEA
ncbi:transposase [Paraburkholderia sp. UYCP14C]|uniref:transposase n=1 Tax=Paraburkholderia sp. UYCP14C TaxID=2511130 RepID=UPI001020A2B3|nr:transposase [Paraburkholderia sp. UYCP14C]RZF30104.1 transposase [Paraburkholderia sp. UYCP14C]